MRALQLFVFFVLSALSSALFADDGPMQLGFSRLSSDGAYTVTASRVVAIFTADPGISGTEKLPDTYVKGRHVWILKSLPVGSRLYAVGLGNDWAGKGPDIKDIDLAKAKAEAPIVNGTARLDFTRPEGQQCRLVNLVIVFSDGTRAWGPTAGDESPYHVHLSGKPALGWCFEGNSIVAMESRQRQTLAGKK